MSCANHPQNPVAAYCRTCGKPLCSNCTRQVMGVVYCENCLAERVSGAPASPYAAPPGAASRVQTTSGPNPGLAGVLGAIPFGVGAIYNGQYIKGLAHLGIFVGLVAALSSNLHPDYWYAVLGISLGFFVLYQIIDAVHTAKAIQAGRPVPDPLGLATMFSPGERVDFRHGAPAGAVVLIVLGVLFLLHNLGIWFLEMDRIWPVFLIFLGVWLYAKRRMTPDGCSRSIAGPAILVTLGVLFLIDNLHGPGWDHTWPVVLLVIGIIKLMERGYLGGHPPSPPMGPLPTSTTSTPQSSTEIDSEVKNG